MELGIPKSTVGQILNQQKFHPYKLQILHHLTEDDPDELRCVNGFPKNWMKTSISRKTVFCLAMKLCFM